MFIGTLLDVLLLQLPKLTSKVKVTQSISELVILTKTNISTTNIVIVLIAIMLIIWSDAYCGIHPMIVIE